MRIFSNECPLEAMDARRQPEHSSTGAGILKRWMDVCAGVCLMGIGSSMRAAKWTLIVCELAPGVCKDGRCFLDPGETSPVPPNRLLSALISWLLITACVSSGWNYLSVSASPSHECVWWLWMGGWGAFYLDWGGMRLRVMQCLCCITHHSFHNTAGSTGLRPAGWKHAISRGQRGPEERG